MTRRIALVGLVVLIAGGSSAAAVLLHGGSSTAKRPTMGTTTTAPVEGDAPSPDIAAADKAFLEGPGKQLLTMHAAARDLAAAAAPTADDCKARAASLNSLIPADAALTLASDLRYEALQNELTAERVSLGVRLTACITGRPPRDGIPDLRASSAAVEGRLRQIGIST